MNNVDADQPIVLMHMTKTVFSTRGSDIQQQIENNRRMSFDIKFTRQGFENDCLHREACRAIQHAFSKPSLINLISKDTNLIFYLSVNPLFHISN